MMPVDVLLPWHCCPGAYPALISLILSILSKKEDSCLQDNKDFLLCDLETKERMVKVLLQNDSTFSIQRVRSQ